MTKWIKIENGFPPLTVPFIAFVRDETYGDCKIYYAYTDPQDEKYYEGCYANGTDRYCRRIGINNNFRHKITHWMTLPETPE